MSANENNQNAYRTILGAVQFDPRDGTAGGKAVRNITVQQAGTHDQALTWSVTLWPGHANFNVALGDVVVVSGKATQTTGTDKDGNPRIYNNLSATGILVLGTLDKGDENGAGGATIRAAAAASGSGEDLF